MDLQSHATLSLEPHDQLCVCLCW